MSIDELLQYNEKCKRLDKIYFTKGVEGKEIKEIEKIEKLVKERKRQ